MSRVRVEPLTPELLDSVWSRARSRDKEEFAFCGCTDETYRDAIGADWLCGLLDGVPACAWANWPGASTLYFGFIATEGLTLRDWLTITRMADAYVGNRMLDHPLLRACVGVWERHVDSIRWLRLLKFEDTGVRLDVGGGRFLVMERRTF